MPPSLEVHSGVAVRARALRNNGRVVQSAEGEVCVARVNGALKGMVAVNSQKPAEVQTAKHAHVPERRDELVVTDEKCVQTGHHDENKCDERRQAPDELANIRKKHPGP